MVSGRVSTSPSYANFSGRTGRTPQPSAWIVGSQSVKTTGVGGEHGYDGAKKVKGGKRHLLVDTQGFVFKAKVHVVASVMDRDGIKQLLVEQVLEMFPRLSHLWLDAGYNAARAKARTTGRRRCLG